MKKTIFGILFILVIAGGITAVYFPVFSIGQASDSMEIQAKSIEKIQAEQGKPVMVTAVKQADLNLVETFYGNVVPYAEANVQGKYGGKITLLKGNEGDTVKKGDIIVGFDETDTQLNLEQDRIGKKIALQGIAQAESNFETIKNDLSRNKKLFNTTAAFFY